MDNDAMAVDDALQLLREAVALHLDVDVSELAPGTDVVRELGLDSLDIIEVVDVVEERLGTELPPEIFEGDTTLQGRAVVLSSFLTAAR
jgi:acyl carrier protein